MRTKAKQQAANRLKRIAGQIQGLGRMIDNDKYCVNIIHQSLAAKAALSALEDFILENHLKTHVAEQMGSGKKDKAIAEIMAVYKLSKKK